MPSRQTTLLVTALTLLAGLAGCIGQGDDLSPTSQETPVRQGLDALTEPVFDTILRTAHTIQGEVQGHETEEIWLDIYRPEGASEGTVPTILVFTPYQALGDARGVTDAAQGEPNVPPEEQPYNEDLVDFFVPRGYAVAFADVRGNHNAGGCIDQSGEGQWWDGHYTIEWLADQPWSNGKVGMIGVSYDGETQVSTALTNPPSLATIVPIASVQSQYQYLYYHGVPYNMQGVSTMAAYLAISAIPGTDPQAATTYHERFTCHPENFEAALDLSGDWSPYWEERAYFKQNAQVTNTSVLHIHGLQDWNVKPDHIDPQFENWNTEKRAIYGQWGHAWPQRDDWAGDEGILHRWMDHHLLGTDTGLMDELPPVLAQDTDERWHALDALVDDAAPTARFQLDAGMALVTERAEAGELILHDYPRDQAPSPIERRAISDAVNQAGSAVTGHETSALWTSEAMAEELVLTGRPTLTLNVSTTEESTHWAAHLVLIHEDGTQEVINRAYQDTRHLDGLDDPKPLTPGEPYQLTLTFFPQMDVIPAGSQLALWLSNDDSWVHQDDTYAMSTLELGPGAVLELPLIQPDAGSVPGDTLVP
ncbi:MAG: CocE/NonD family hydrolase [Candidatus Thermoplasmatota archaeon]|nr:CocE/NonD family hydrolase [Candidatus Thermoplasmatota archaeon]